MAYDPNDADTKAAVAAAVDAALEAQKEEHEAEIAGLKANRDKLKADLRKARTNPDQGAEDQSNEIERLESELRTNKADLAKANRDLKNAIRERDENKASLDVETRAADDGAIETGLTAELARVNVAPQFQDATKALLRGQVTVKREADGKRVVLAGDKPLGEFVTTWSQGDQGKNFVSAPDNRGSGGGGSGGSSGSAPGAGNKAYRDMSNQERFDMNKSDPVKFNASREQWIKDGKPGPTPKT